MWNDWIKTRHRTIYRSDLFSFIQEQQLWVSYTVGTTQFRRFHQLFNWCDVEINADGEEGGRRGREAVAAVCISIAIRERNR